MACLGSFSAVNRKTFRILLVAAMLVSAGFASWAWIRPYEWGASDEARSQIEGCLVKQDRSNYWINLHLKMHPGKEHDLRLPVRLITGDGRKLEPASTEMSGTDEEGTTDLWFKFWLEQADLDGPLKLKINEGVLSVREGSGVPDMDQSKEKYFVTNQW